MRSIKPVQKVVDAFEALPGIGPKTAARLAYYLLNVPQEKMDKFAKALENVAVTVEEWPTPQDLRSVGISHGTLFGLYRGVPKPARAGIPPVVPDKIVIFSGPILAFSSDPNAAREQIRKTVLHEIGHYFGMSEEEIRRSGN